jgi:Phospholipase C
MQDQRNSGIDLSRRRLLAGLAAASLGGAGLSACGSSESPANADASTQALPAPEDSGIDHIIVVMMENRSFDHYLGWVPGANGRQAGLSFKDSNGEAQTTHDLAPNYQNCASADPDHSYDGGRTQLNGSEMDGFLLTQPVGDTFPIGYYTADSLPFFKGVVDNWTLCDRYHSGILSSTFPNRMYMHGGQTDRLSNTDKPYTLPTVWTR